MQLTKPFRYLLHAIWFLLFALAIIQYKERLFADASYYFFHAINSGGFHVEHGRIVLGLSQLLPLIGYYLFLPLKFLMVLASLGHELFYYSLFLLILYKLKDEAGAISLLLVHLIGQLWLYYSPMLEICYGAALAVFFYSILRSGKYKDDKWLLLLLLVQWFAMSSHPENFLLIAFALAYDFLKRGFQKRIHLSTAAFLLIAFVVELLTFSEYELGHTNLVSEGSPAGIGNLFQAEYIAELFTMFLNYFPELIGLFLISLALCFYRKAWLKALLISGSVFVLVAIVNQVAVAKDFTRYYESMYNPLVTLIVVFAVYELALLQSKSWKQLATLALIVMALIRINWTWQEGDYLRKRVDQLDRLTDYAQTLGGSKYLVKGENFHSYYTSITWANSIETLLFSAADGPEASVTIPEEGEMYYEKNHKILNDSNYMFRRFEVVPLSFLNPRFFQLDREPYHKLNNAGFTLPPEELKKQLKLRIVEADQELHAGDSAYFLVEIDNASGSKLPSALTDGVYLSYHWLQNGKIVDWDGVRTPLEVDVYGKYQQHFKVKMPAEKGSYELVPDLVIEGKMWFELKDSFPLQVD